VEADPIPTGRREVRHEDESEAPRGVGGARHRGSKARVHWLLLSERCNAGGARGTAGGVEDRRASDPDVEPEGPGPDQSACGRGEELGPDGATSVAQSGLGTSTRKASTELCEEGEFVGAVLVQQAPGGTRKSTVQSATGSDRRQEQLGLSGPEKWCDGLTRIIRGAAESAQCVVESVR
jgi:hypothetical protein